MPDNHDHTSTEIHNYQILASSKDRGNDNNEQENQNSDDDTNAHLHIFPPHLLSNSVCTAAKALGRNSQVVRLILESIQALTSIVGFVDVVSQDSHGVVDVLETQVSTAYGRGVLR